jgi:hypothetical protein
LLAVVATLALAQVAQAASSAEAAGGSAAVKRGLYDCYSFSLSLGITTYQGSVVLKAGGRYSHAAGRDGRKLINPRNGRYGQAGKRINFKSGPLSDLYGIEKAATKFDVWAKSERVKSWTCYAE